MKFSISREALLKPLNLAAGVVERRQTLPILANVLLALEDGRLSLTGTDLEVELIGHVDLEQPPASAGEVTVPARKLVDICKALPDGSRIDFSLDDNRLVVRSGRSRFVLSTLPASDFPNVESSAGEVEFELRQGDLKRLIDRTGFAMAQQDVRYYLNGMLWEVKGNRLRTVATDGHRLAMCTLEMPADIADAVQVILPRKGVLELARLLMNEDEPVRVVIGTNHFRAFAGEFQFTSKLVDGKFPDYERVLPRAATKVVYGDREEMRHALSRASILSNEKYRGIRLSLENGSLRIVANNPEQEEAEDEISVDYQGDALEIGFNVSYLLDVLGVLSERNVKLSLSDANSSALLEEAEAGDSLYVVMPMRL
ncbi:MAG: DNA polymerase III subunit beta [Spongiibacteraceae bacterium]|jgi:DNA polymerase-3 subunit beta|nr:DNA polymerase III subunit beta [Spongiibacteraceae bacterium]